VGYHFKKASEADNRIIAITTPLSVDIAGKKMHWAHLDFDDDTPTPGTAMPMLQMFSALNFSVAGGDGGTDVGLQMGVAPLLDGFPVFAPPLMPGSSLDARAVGGNGGDPVGIVLYVDPASTGLINASVAGGAGDDNLRLDVYGIGNPDLL